MKKVKIRSIEENEITRASEFLAGTESFGGAFQGDLEKLLTRQFHRQKELLIGAFDVAGLLKGVLVATGQGDTVSIERIAVENMTGNELAKQLIVAQEKAARHYGYLRIFLWAPEEKQGFLVTHGYKPGLFFTFSDKRQKVLALLADLYPMWVDAGGQMVKVLLGTDYLEEGLKANLAKLPVKIDYLYLKNL